MDNDFNPPPCKCTYAFIDWCEANGITGHDYQREAYEIFLAGWLAASGDNK